MEDELDALLSQLDCEQFLTDLGPVHLDPDLTSPDPTHSKPLPDNNIAANKPLPSARFAQVTDSELQEAQFPRTQQKAPAGQSISNRQLAFPSHTEWPTHLMLAQPQQLDYWLSKFVLEVRKANGEHYPPDTLYCICTGLLRYIRETRPEINIFKSPTYDGFQKTIDSEMKRLRSTGLGVKKRQAELITTEEENQLWEKGFLGDSTPRVLLDTMLYLSGIHFALRSGEEHRSLQLSQIELISHPDGSAHLIYTENFSKNIQLHRKVKPKQVTCYANEENPRRCLVTLFQSYLGHRPLDTQ